MKTGLSFVLNVLLGLTLIIAQSPTPKQAMAAYEQAEYEECVQMVSKVLKKAGGSDRVKLLLYRAESYYQLSKDPKTAEKYPNAIELATKDAMTATRSASPKDKNIKKFRPFLDTISNITVRKGMELYNQKKYSEAKPIFIQAGKIDPNGMGYYYAGKCALNNNEKDYINSFTPIAEAQYADFKSKKPKLKDKYNSEVFAELIRYYAQVNNYLKAQELLMQATEMFPNDSKVKELKMTPIMQTTKKKDPKTKKLKFFYEPYTTEQITFADSLINAHKSTIDILATEVNKKRPSPAALSTELCRSATLHAWDMRTINYYSSAGVNKSDATKRAKQAGYEGKCVECIYVGTKDPAEVLKAWMAQEVSQMNLTKPDAKQMGVGIVPVAEHNSIPEQKTEGFFWVIVLGNK
ncbi:MAG: CAP domain-containing protein [Bacteroidia bacterium]|nr:CAP domain-containing protein [Bacteroidia bacterium]MDW8346978.1 CAP domain-containing protein [Bacteroidia bacterium]